MITRRTGHFTSQKYKEVVPAILKELEYYAWLKFKTDNGTPIKIHILHNTYELRDNLVAANAFTSSRADIARIHVLPALHPDEQKFRSRFYPKGFKRNPVNNADAVVYFKKREAWVVEFKYIKGGGRRLLRHIIDAVEKADFTIIVVTKKSTLTSNSIARTASEPLRAEIIKGIIVLNEEGYVIYL